ncbi:hypothetical protein COV53_03240 [Candidatus Gottesmanbacteria bacterium CG11_big_fil_rev_8_21_14_0_20_37_11]|uniref:Uncharacterized protein n=3 Tax=Candidatus Gottesmaniibacteriota TaxID=1752720 RepID=A0A2M7RR88_9BACT|nr:MAG: hypothetical protein AUJ73_03840 [Candidatus Gottesmanbacteria bacterium CG1_02_37_22]PIP33292.1 MAG: hypothetical protein COX23_00135 [Candidatus Gottesmanbacteria bacterium CG23_combo_of_CG06-09_8_20_14_all_37_19]PIR08395.1 MAG: hypothetical protein COV53_03240 [Candidatus Gottesmanbacteria bacterium CG11_big_fil_rev_8_21_14_0_20_37_11]PIZ02710.1 MAG: hypothetical protein COY59_03325 [Candidatus Gottesmanbacteria bacterium CG_4_10_14_0_8_um_filter_37_24]
MHPHVNKQFIFLVSLTAVTLFTALIAITLSNDLRKRTSDKYLTSQALASDQPLEIKKISLGENPSTDSRSSLKDGKLQLTISKGALDPEASREQDLTFALLPANTDIEILRFSLNLSKSSEDKKDDSGIVRSQPNHIAETTPNQDAKTQYLYAQEEKTAPAGKDQLQLKFSDNSINEKKNYYTLEYNFSELEELYAHSSLKFLWFNNQNSSWEEIPTTVDEASSKIIAQVDHLSDFTVSGQKAQVFSPTLKN